MLNSVKHDNSVLVLGHDARMLLPIVRSLGRHGLKVDLAYCPFDSPAAHSKYIRTIHQITPPADNDETWIDELKELIEEQQYQLVIPASEAIVFKIQSRMSDFQDIQSIYLINQITFETAFDKTRTFDLSRELNISVPVSKICKSREEFNTYLRDDKYPVFLKPACSVGCEELSDKIFVTKASSRKEAEDQFNALHAANIPVLIQKEVAGTGVGIDFIAHEGEILVAHQHRRLHETTGHGSTYRISEEINTELHDAASKIIRALDYTGVGMCEFRLDQMTKEWWFIELNARFWGSLPLASAAGVDFPLYLYEMLVHGKKEFSPSYQHGTRCRNMRNDIRWSSNWIRQQISNQAGLKAQKEGWKVNHVSAGQLTSDCLRLLLLNDHQDVFSFDDVNPGLWETKQIARSILKRLKLVK